MKSYYLTERHFSCLVDLSKYTRYGLCVAVEWIRGFTVQQGFTLATELIRNLNAINEVDVEMTFTWNVSLEICSNWETGLFNSTLLYTFVLVFFVPCSLNCINAKHREVESNC